MFNLPLPLHYTSDIPCDCDVPGVILLSVVSSSMEHSKNHHKNSFGHKHIKIEKRVPPEAYERLRCH